MEGEREGGRKGGVFPITVQYPLPSAAARESSNEGGGGGAVSQTKQNQSD